MVCSDPNQPAADVKRHTVAESSNMMHISFSPKYKNATAPSPCLLLGESKELHFQTGDQLLELANSATFIKNERASRRGNKVSPFFAAGGEISVPGERSRRR